jgi:site-specific recombinase XerD
VRLARLRRGPALAAADKKTAGTERADDALMLSPDARALRARFPRRTVALAWDTTRLDRDALVARSLRPPFALESRASRRARQVWLTGILDWLQSLPGHTWQDRWKASGVDTGGHAAPDWKDIPVAWLRNAGRGYGGDPAEGLNAALLQLICGDIVRPSIPWLLTCRSHMYLPGEMARVRDPDGFAALRAAGRDAAISSTTESGALRRIAYVMAAKGGTVREVTVGDCLEMLDLQAEYVQKGLAGNGPHFYQLMRTIGAFPDDAPATVLMLHSSYRGQLTAAQLIDRYDLACRPVRHLLVDYLQERQPALDYTSLSGIATQLGLTFWKDLENHHPGISSLDLPLDVAVAWKERLKTKPAPGDAAGRFARLATGICLQTVRAFYLDIAEWAAEDPARWGPWAVRCPVRPADIQNRKEKGEAKSRMDQRTRERLPSLPLVAAALDKARTDAAALLESARQTPDLEHFTAADQTMRRLASSTSKERVWARDTDGAQRDLLREEDRAFWVWAVVEVLRHTGIRVEELTELSHHSLVQYRVQGNGELVPLLHIAPSKTDQERLLVISPELADVLATVIQRVRAKDGAVPLVASYDREKVWNPPMPLLFQHPLGIENRPISISAVRQLLAHAFNQAGLVTDSGEPLRYVPHDFRRIFVTEAIMNGMPPHIAQLLLGHKDINVTMGYKAVYPKEAIAAHRAFIARRRTMRPGVEYRTPTDEEWNEFLGHFERRKLALGDCGRAWGTACVHEHSCIRCPLLRVDPARRPRLEEIRDSLAARITEAERQGWAGDLEGLNISLSRANGKLAQVDRTIARRSTTADLGMPAYRDMAGVTVVIPER